MATAKRIYVVRNRATNEVGLMRAMNKTQARNAAAMDTFEVNIATQEELVSLIAEGKAVVNAVDPDPDSD